MGYEVLLNDTHVIATLGQDNKLNYNHKEMGVAIKEMVEGMPSGGFVANLRIAYRWDANRRQNNDHIWKLWKVNPIMQNRITQLNALVFGRGLKWIYEGRTQKVIDRFWRINRLKDKLSMISTDAQLYGEVFIALYPQASGDTLLNIYESNQVDIEYDAGDVSNILKYHVSYYDQDKREDIRLEFQPIEKYLNIVEFQKPIGNDIVNKVRRALGLYGRDGVQGQGVMCHIKFNNSSSEVHGTSDFKQTYDILPDYMLFVGDRLAIHQTYGSPAWDITIDTDDPAVIANRITELAGFRIGSNPVHNSKEVWKPLEFEEGALNATNDERMLRGLLCAGTGFPEYLLFNQSESGSNDNAFALTKIAEDRQDRFMNMFDDIHRAVMCFAGFSSEDIDGGQIVFPAISTMSEKQKAETSMLEVNANICSRKTAAMMMGHNWDIEKAQIEEEAKFLAPLIQMLQPANNDDAGRVGGYEAGKGKGSPEGDHGVDDKTARANGENITTQVQGERKEND